MMGAAYPIGFIGLGTMGEAMALTLVKAGTRLLVWNRTRAKAEILAAAGADVARDAADVFAQSATVFLMLVDGGAIDTVLDRGGTAFAARVTGRTVVHWVRPRRPIRVSSKQTFALSGDTTSKRPSPVHASPPRPANSSLCSPATQTPSLTLARC
jgi:predicted dinucleotide-binding enzyme